MEKEKDIYYGIALSYCIGIIALLLTALVSGVIGAVAPVEYLKYTPIGSLVIYVLALYIVFWRLQSFPDIKIWFFAGLLVVQYLPYFLYIYSPEDEWVLDSVSVYNNSIPVIYNICFAYFAYKLYKKADKQFGVKDEDNPIYIYYGMASVPLISALLEIVSASLLTLSRGFTIPVYLVYAIVIVLFLLFFYLFFMIITKKPKIRGWYILIIPAASLCAGWLSTWYPEYKYSITEYFDINVALAELESYTLFGIFLVSYIRYYQLNSNGNPKGASNNKNRIYCIILALLLLAGNYALDRFASNIYHEREVSLHEGRASDDIAKE